MTRPSSVLVSGYYGCGNAGDEAVLAGLVEGFRRSDPAVELTVLSGDPRATESEHGVRAVPRGLGSAWRHARASDLLISGGGGLLQDTTSWRSPLYYLGVIKLAQAAGIPVACLGQGIGPLRRRFVRFLARRVLSRVQLITVRDRRSSEALRELGLARHVEITADLAFLLPSPSREESDQAWQKAGLLPDERPVAVIALRQPAPGRPGCPSKAPAEAIGGACGQLGLRMVLLPMHPERDSGFTTQVARSLPSGAEFVFGGMPARELLALIGKCHLVIAMRLHTLIFAAICGVPPVAISYDPKVDALMEQLGLRSCTSTADFDPKALSRAIHEAWRARGEFSVLLPPRAEKLRQAARRNIQLTLDLLGRRA